MRTFTVPLAILLLVAAVGVLAYETWAVAAAAGRQEIAARAFALRAERALSELQRERSAHATATAELDRLQARLGQTGSQLAAMADAVTEAKANAERRVAAARDAERRALAAMPDGVRQCLDALHTCLLAEGFGSVRFLRARSLDDDGLHDVEAIQTHADGLGADLVVAGTMKAALDRAGQRFVLTFFDGTHTQAGERVPLPEAGWNIVFEPVDGRLLEQRLPYLVVADGVYPRDVEPTREIRETDVDITTRVAWLERFDRLLEAGGTPEKIQIQRFRGIENGSFLEAQLLATDERGHVEYGASCKRLSVEVDRTAEVVWLVLREGFMNRGEAESTITAEGYRILLPGLKPKRAVELMLGLVVHK